MISRIEFENCAQRLVQLSSKLDDLNQHWHWKCHSDSDVRSASSSHGYMVKATPVCFVQRRNESARKTNVQDLFIVFSDSEESDCDDASRLRELCDDDDESALSSIQSNAGSSSGSCFAHLFDVHIVYSSTYRVPVLYFHPHLPSGELLDVDDVWRDLATQYDGSDDRDSVVTQAEHPILGLPFFHVHPCRTAALLREANVKSSATYLISWLSSIGALLCIRPSLALVKLALELKN
jgi:Autophagocytosis associated protein, active-site domain